MDTLVILKYILLLLLVLSWTLTPFCKKRAIGKLNIKEYFVVNFILTSFLATLFWVYLIYIEKLPVNIFNKMERSEFYWALVAALLSIIGAICLIYLIKQYDVSYIMPQINPCVIILTALFGLLIFGEKITWKRGIGLLLIFYGLIIIN